MSILLSSNSKIREERENYNAMDKMNTETAEEPEGHRGNI